MGYHSCKWDRQDLAGSARALAALLAAVFVTAACDRSETDAEQPSSIQIPDGSSPINGAPRAGSSGSGQVGGAGSRAGAAGTNHTAGSSGADAPASDAAVALDAAEPQPDAARDAASGNGQADPDAVWSALSVMALVDVADHGAIGDGVADDLAALDESVKALPEAGGIVYLSANATLRKTDLLIITKSHVKLWAPNRQAEVFQSVAGQRRKQSIICRNNQGCGFFGLKLRSDASTRFDALEDNQISADHGSLIEVVGCEIDGSAAVGVMLYGSVEQYVEGNYVHHTWADHIHHTDAARQSWVWNNYVFNEQPSRGDDGVACVTYGPTSPRCGDMEWWHNTILHTEWGRGYSVIGGDAIRIHDNWAIGVAGAGVIVASEGSYNSASSDGISIERNDVYRCGHAIGHPGILVSGQNAAADPLHDIALRDNVVVETANGGAYRAEGDYANVSNDGMKTASVDFPTPIPTMADVHMADTSVLRTRDVSHVPAQFRAGLYRIHVRHVPAGDGFQQRFEYVVKGSVAVVSELVSARQSAGDYLSEQRTAGDSAYALLLTSAPLAIPDALSGVSFRDLRTGDQDGELSWLWQRLDAGTY